MPQVILAACLPGSCLLVVAESVLCYHSHVRANITTKSNPQKVFSLMASEDLCHVPCFKEGLVKRLQGTMPVEEVLEDARALFAALADRARLKILYALKDGDELCVCDVAHVLGCSVSAASHHLRKLRNLKVLTSPHDGKIAYYSLRDRFATAIVAKALAKAKG
jgi:ArsR family transcriptional regulator, lead/cadmium/zinc/bismuth-responsive transcriptional repressor